MADVFVSYKREDAARVKKLVGALRATGLDVWWDEDIPPSAPWEATIERALRDAKSVIVCWSPASVASENVRSEARVARNDGRLIQVFLKPCEPPLFFGERQGVDVGGWRGNAGDPRVARIATSVRKVAAGERAEGEVQPQTRGLPRLRLSIAIATLIVLVGSVTSWWLLSPTKMQGPMTLAVLPFRALNPADANLVDAIWDDTRGAIGRNPNLRVLGREAVTALAKKDLTPADYRTKVGADYLLDGSVEHVGDQVRMKLSLTRTNDSAEVWSDEVGGKLDDVFAFQQRVANEVEGRIRGRVAPGGGVTDRNIATSGETYAIYADARALMRKRDAASFRAAIPLLRKALAMDPNYAPAWASLGQAFGYLLATDVNMGAKEKNDLAVQYLNRSLQLAPNLSQAHAALGMVQGMKPEAEVQLRKAVALDPNNSEAWGWLGNLLARDARYMEALPAYTRAEQIEPLWSFTVINRVGCLATLRDMSGLNAEYQRLTEAGDQVLLMKAQAAAAGVFGHPGDKIRVSLQLRQLHPEAAAWIDNRLAFDLYGLGFVDEAMSTGRITSEQVAEYRGQPASPSEIRKNLKSPIDFWLSVERPFVYGRTLPSHGRLDEYIGYYRAAFANADDFATQYGPSRFIAIAPNLAANLKAAGMNDEADALFRAFDPTLAAVAHGRISAEDSMVLAQFRAAAGRDDEAVKLLVQAVSNGWLPDGRFWATDISDEPCFANLTTRPEFLAVRQRIFARIEEERRKVPPKLLALAYPVKSAKAAA